MERILERYERYSFAERQLAPTEPQSPANWSLEYSKLKARIELLERNHRYNHIKPMILKPDGTVGFNWFDRKQIKEKGKEMVHPMQWEREYGPNAPPPPPFLMAPPLPCLNIGGVFEGEATEERRNELDLTLDSLYSCHLGCFAS
ncbi:mads box protein [Dorcoceras hygrometricum]|uniref:Mads box protein n=1 Tax=Dorcoceras hygrometricum TaxID=472368 RepID=A0A2Z7BTW6_9LAMI|nr:mads box protein [Dorcoceras hygrometricum]